MRSCWIIDQAEFSTLTAHRQNTLLSNILEEATKMLIDVSKVRGAPIETVTRRIALFAEHAKLYGPIDAKHNKHMHDLKLIEAWESQPDVSYIETYPAVIAYYDAAKSLYREVLLNEGPGLATGQAIGGLVAGVALRDLRQTYEEASRGYRGALAQLDARLKPISAGDWTSNMSNAIQGTATMLPSKLTYDDALQRLRDAEAGAASTVALDRDVAAQVRAETTQKSMDKATWAYVRLTRAITAAAIVSTLATSVSVWVAYRAARQAAATPVCVQGLPSK